MSKVAMVVKRSPVMATIRAPAPARSAPVPASLLAGASVPSGWQVDDLTGEIRRDLVHSMLRRRKGWNYKGPGWYMITLTLADRSQGWLGQLVVGEAPSSKLEGTGCGGAATGGGAAACAREIARGRFPPIAYRGARVENVAQLAAVALSKKNEI